MYTNMVLEYMLIHMVGLLYEFIIDKAKLSDYSDVE